MARYRFTFARAVPADDPIAQWVTGPGPGLAGSHVWEVCKLPRAGMSNGEPGRKELQRALAAFGRDNHEGELWLDRDLRNARARWADDIAAQLFVRSGGEDPSRPAP